MSALVTVGYPADAGMLAERKDRSKLGLAKFTAEAAKQAAEHPDKLEIASSDDHFAASPDRRVADSGSSHDARAGVGPSVNNACARPALDFWKNVRNLLYRCYH